MFGFKKKKTNQEPSEEMNFQVVTMKDALKGLDQKKTKAGSTTRSGFSFFKKSKAKSGDKKMAGSSSAKNKPQENSYLETETRHISDTALNLKDPIEEKPAQAIDLPKPMSVIDPSEESPNALAPLERFVQRENDATGKIKNDKSEEKIADAEKKQEPKKENEANDAKNGLAFIPVDDQQKPEPDLKRIEKRAFFETIAQKNKLQAEKIVPQPTLDKIQTETKPELHPTTSSQPAEKTKEVRAKKNKSEETAGPTASNLEKEKVHPIRPAATAIPKEVNGESEIQKQLPADSTHALDETKQLPPKNTAGRTQLDTARAFPPRQEQAVPTSSLEKKPESIPKNETDFLDRPTNEVAMSPFQEINREKKPFLDKRDFIQNQQAVEDPMEKEAYAVSEQKSLEMPYSQAAPALEPKREVDKDERDDEWMKVINERIEVPKELENEPALPRPGIVAQHSPTQTEYHQQEQAEKRETPALEKILLTPDSKLSSKATSPLNISTNKEPSSQPKYFSRQGPFQRLYTKTGTSPLRPPVAKPEPSQPNEKELGVKNRIPDPSVENQRSIPGIEKPTIKPVSDQYSKEDVSGYPHAIQKPVLAQAPKVAPPPITTPKPVLSEPEIKSPSSDVKTAPIEPAQTSRASEIAMPIAPPEPKPVQRPKPEAPKVQQFDTTALPAKQVPAPETLQPQEEKLMQPAVSKPSPQTIAAPEPTAPVASANKQAIQQQAELQKPQEKKQIRIEQENKPPEGIPKMTFESIEELERALEKDNQPPTEQFHQPTNEVAEPEDRGFQQSPSGPFFEKAQTYQKQAPEKARRSAKDILSTKLENYRANLSERRSAKKIARQRPVDEVDFQKSRVNKPLLAIAVILILLTIGSGYYYYKYSLKGNNGNEIPFISDSTIPNPLDNIIPNKEKEIQPIGPSPILENADVQQFNKNDMVASLKKYLSDTKENPRQNVGLRNGFFIKPFDENNAEISSIALLDSMNIDLQEIHPYLDQDAYIFFLRNRKKISTDPIVAKVSFLLKLKDETSDDQIMETIKSIEPVLPTELQVLFLDEEKPPVPQNIVFKSVFTKSKIGPQIRYFNFTDSDTTKSIEWGIFNINDKKYLSLSTSKHSTDSMMLIFE